MSTKPKLLLKTDLFLFFSASNCQKLTTTVGILTEYISLGNTQFIVFPIKMYPLLVFNVKLAI